MAVVAWAMMRHVVLTMLDRVAFIGLIPWAFAAGHVLYGAVLRLALGPWGRESPSWGRPGHGLAAVAEGPARRLVAPDARVRRRTAGSD